MAAYNYSKMDRFEPHHGDGRYKAMEAKIVYPSMLNTKNTYATGI